MMVEKQIDICWFDGSIKTIRRGYYWRKRIGEGHFGPLWGPFGTIEDARAAAEIIAEAKT